MTRPYTREQLNAMTWDEIVDVGVNEYKVNNFWSKPHMVDWFVAKDHGYEPPDHPPLDQRMKVQLSRHRRKEEGPPAEKILENPPTAQPIPVLTLAEKLSLAGKGVQIPEPNPEDLDPVEALALKERLAEHGLVDDTIPYRFEEKTPALEPWKMLNLDTGPRAIPKERPMRPTGAVLETVTAEPEPLPGGVINLTAEQLATCFLCRVEAAGYSENMKCCATYLGGDNVRLSITDLTNGDRRYIITLPKQISVEARPCV